MSTLLDQIEEGALDSGSNLADVLRKCIALGSRSGSETLREWATHELKGYGDSTLPDYRVIPATLAVDFRTITHHVTGYQISTFQLPEPARSTLKEEVHLGGSIAEIVDALEASRPNDNTVMFGIPGGSLLVNLMNRAGGSSQVIDRVYFKCSATSLIGVIDTVRTNLVELVAEMRLASNNGNDASPPKEAVDRAVEIVVHGGQANIHIASHNVVTDSQNIALASEDVRQVLAELPPQGDVDALLGWLIDHDVPGSMVDELKNAIDSDAATGNPILGPGDKVRAWIANASLKGASAIGTGVSVELVVEAIKRFFGI